MTILTPYQLLILLEHSMGLIDRWDTQEARQSAEELASMGYLESDIWQDGHRYKITIEGCDLIESIRAQGRKKN